MLYYNKSASAVLHELDTNERGLSHIEADERLRQHGPNTIRVHGESLWRKLIEPFVNVFVFVLLIAAGISAIQGHALDATIILVIITISAVIYYVQRFSTERILRSLRKHDTQFVETLRNGKSAKVDATQLVPGDIIILGEGEKIPADARLVAVTNVRTDESLLTGESIPVSKEIEALHGEKGVFERANMLFQGSFIVSGEATAVVVATGNATEFGQIAALTGKGETSSPIQKKIDRLVTQIIGVVAAMALVAFGLSLLRGMELADAIQFVVALSVSAVPESLPIAISVVLVLGMRRMAAKKALIRNMRAIESIGAVTTIATDKTGTLTKNKLTVQTAWSLSQKGHPIDDIMAKVVNHGSRNINDPLDVALLDYIHEKKIAGPAGTRHATLPFDQAMAMSGNIWRHGANYTLTVKGAPEQVLQRSSLTSTEHEHATMKLHELTSKGYRVIALATATLGKPVGRFEDMSSRTRFDFIGFVAVADVLRPEARKAISAALTAGVTVRMITGDHQETAYHIAHDLGMVSTRDQVFDARRMNVMTDEELDHLIRDVRVFSRVTPEHKFRILELLKRHHITAMTGDGVNDVPALAGAHVGIAMGSGSQIAKDAGDIILLDDNFKSIITAVEQGRVIISNIRRMLYYLLSTNAGEALTMMGALVVGMPVPLAPVQILWINLVTDSALVIPLGLEPGEKNNMRRPPKRPKAPILSKYMVSRMVLMALSMATLTLCIYSFYLNQYGHAYAQTVAFSSLVVMQWANALNARSDYQSFFTRIKSINKPFIVGLVIAVSLQMLVIFGPLQDILHITPVAIGDLFVAGLIALIVPLAIAEIHKYFGRRHILSSNSRV